MQQSSNEQVSKRDMPVLPKQPKSTRRSRKLLFFLLLFFVIICILLFFQSSLSRISSIDITGNDLLPKAEIEAASGIAAGDHFFVVSSKAVQKRIALLHMVKSVHVKKRFPGAISIQVVEHPRVAFEINAEGKLGAVLADGTFVEQPPAVIPDKPVLTGWGQDAPGKKKLSEALAAISATQLANISEIKPAPSDAYPDKIKLYTRNDFEVFTTISYLPAKIKTLQTYIDNLKERKVTSGTLTLLEVDSHNEYELEPVPVSDATPAKNTSGKSGNDTKEKATPKPTPKPSPSNKATVKPTDKEAPKSTPKVSPTTPPKTNANSDSANS